MMELEKHIEALLLENDCVIVPGFGGFITYYSKAKLLEEENVFLPPFRTVGFNPRLKINDGLLVQSYMQAYHTDFPDAEKKVRQDVEKLISFMHEEGKIEIHGVGKIYLTKNNIYEFHPDESGVLTPALYGLSSFECIPLKEKKIANQEYLQEPVPSPHKNYEIKINRSLVRQVAGIAAAILLFFFLSTPVENTYIEKENYAFLGSSDLFETIRSKSIATALITSIGQTPQQNNSKRALSSKKESRLKPVNVKVEKVPASLNPTVQKAKPEVPTSSVQKYNIIVTSGISKVHAQDYLNKLKRDGHQGASIIERDGKIRVSLISFSNKDEAYRMLNQIRKTDPFKDAWLLTL